MPSNLRSYRVRGSLSFVKSAKLKAVGYYTFFLMTIPMVIVPFSQIGRTLQLYRRTLVR
jgi:hypothetical protein